MDQEAMNGADRLTLISIGAIVTIAIVNGNCTSNERFRDLQVRMTSLENRVETGFSAAASERRDAASERREEHGQIIRRVERLENLHLKPAPAAQAISPIVTVTGATAG